MPETRAYLKHGGIFIEVITLDKRNAWGRTDILVQPVSGIGKAWVYETSIYDDKTEDES